MGLAELKPRGQRGCSFQEALGHLFCHLFPLPEAGLLPWLVVAAFSASLASHVTPAPTPLLLFYLEMPSWQPMLCCGSHSVSVKVYWCW